MVADGTLVVVPMYNEASVIAATVSDIKRVFPHVLCVDDGSNDDSATVARNAGAIVLRHVVNRGQGAALRTAFDYALTRTACEHVITFDADGQHLVSDARRLLDTARQEGLDVVLASRFAGAAPGIPRAKAMLLGAAVWFTRSTTGLEVSDTHNGLRVLSRGAVCAIDLQLPGMAHASELLASVAKAGLAYGEVPTTVLYTEYSRAKGQRLSNALNIIFDLAFHRMRAAR